MSRALVRVRHDGIEGTALVPETALRHLKGWELVDDDTDGPDNTETPVTGPGDGEPPADGTHDGGDAEEE